MDFKDIISMKYHWARIPSEFKLVCENLKDHEFPVFGRQNLTIEVCYDPIYEYGLLRVADRSSVKYEGIVDVSDLCKEAPPRDAPRADHEIFRKSLAERILNSYQRSLEGPGPQNEVMLKLR